MRENADVTYTTELAFEACQTVFTEAFDERRKKARLAQLKAKK